MKTRILESKSGVTRVEINELAEKVGFGVNYFADEGKWQYTLARTQIAYIRKDGLLIAFGRMLEDGQMCMFYDICVHPDYQKQGYGSAIMGHLVGKTKDKNYVSIGLFASDQNKTVPDFYQHHGFEPSRAMELKSNMRK